MMTGNFQMTSSAVCILREYTEWLRKVSHYRIINSHKSYYSINITCISMNKHICIISVQLDRYAWNTILNIVNIQQEQ